MNPYLRLALVALLPVGTSVLLFLLNNRTDFQNLKPGTKQIIYGVIFGILAIFGTEKGIPINGAQVNCRDAAVLTAGLFFGGPAGIIAGLIGGVQRWFASYRGIGVYTQVACATATFTAGILAALIRKFLFDNKKTSWILSFIIGLVIEVFHMTMVFLTHMEDPVGALGVVRSCTAPMLLANGFSVMFSAMTLSLLSREKIFISSDNTRISQKIERWLIIMVCFAFVITTVFILSIQNNIAKKQTDSLLSITLNDISEDIYDASNANMTRLAKLVQTDLRFHESLEKIMKKYDISEVSLVDRKGIITESTNPDFIGFDFSQGKQSAEFLCLLEDKEEYVQEYGPISYDDSIFRKYAGVRTDAGFIQIGYDAEHFQKDIHSQVLILAKNRHIGQSGYVLVFDEQMKLINAPDTFDGNIEIAHTDYPENETFLFEINGTPCYCRYRTAEGYNIVAIYPKEEAEQMRNLSIWINSFMEVLVFAILFGLIFLLIKKLVVNQILRIANSLSLIAAGNLNETLNVKSSREFASLSDDINTTVDVLKGYIKAAEERINKELELAKDIQSAVLPTAYPAFPMRKEFDIYASMNPAKEVGGDFYDYYLTKGNTLNFMIADVSGKGIPAAMFMMRAKSELKNLTETGIPVNDVFTFGNEALCYGNEAGMFVTAWQGSLDTHSGELSFSNAGHNPPLIRRKNGKFEYLVSRAGFVLAGMEGIHYKLNSLTLEPGDALFLYTDGVTEATNANNELYGEDRLLNAINAQDFTNMKDLCDAITQDVTVFVGDAPQFDDMTMVALVYSGVPEVPTICFENARTEDVTAATEFVEGELEKLDCPRKAIIQLGIAIDEIFSNIVKYAYPNTSGPIRLSVSETPDSNGVQLTFTDEGVPFNPMPREDPDITLSAEERQIGGLGIYMVKQMMDDILYVYQNERNILTLVKYFE